MANANKSFKHWAQKIAGQIANTALIGSIFAKKKYWIKFFEKTERPPMDKPNICWEVDPLKHRICGMIGPIDIGWVDGSKASLYRAFYGGYFLGTYCTKKQAMQAVVSKFMEDAFV